MELTVLVTTVVAQAEALKNRAALNTFPMEKVVAEESERDNIVSLLE